MHVGSAIAQALEDHGTEHVFLVPGESYLAVLDGLHDTDISTIVCRHEGGAAYMADAYGKATGKPGVVMVTRGPGAANAKIGVYTAWQDAVPLVLFIGLIPREDRYRESFQEFDPHQWFGSIAKGVFIVDEPDRASGVVANAMRLAQQGRPGPVVVGLPEDVVAAQFPGGELAPPIKVAHGSVSTADAEVLKEHLEKAERPLIFEGGQGWTQEACDAVQQFAEEHEIPVVGDTRSSDRIGFDSPANAGWLGTARKEETAQLLDDADLLITVGGILWDKPTDNFTRRQDYGAANIVITPDPDLVGHTAAVTRHIIASPVAFAEALGSLKLDSTPDTSEWFTRARELHLEHSTLPTVAKRYDEPAGCVDMHDVMEALIKQLPDDAICTYGAGNHCFWPQRFFPTRTFPSMIANRLGSMGYSLPAGIASKLAFPDRFTVVFTGDGEFMMNGNELITAVRYHTPVLIVVVDNAQYGTIRMHQEKHYPGRVSGTQLENPEFCKLAEANGAWAAKLDGPAQVDNTVEEAVRQVADGRVALLHVRVDQEQAEPLP